MFRVSVPMLFESPPVTGGFLKRKVFVVQCGLPRELAVLTAEALATPLCSKIGIPHVEEVSDTIPIPMKQTELEKLMGTPRRYFPRQREEICDWKWAV